MRDIALHHDTFIYLDQFSVKFINHRMLSLASVKFPFSIVCSSFFVYFFASPDQRNICEFTLCCDFQLVRQFLRYIVIYFLSVEPLLLIVIVDLQISSSNAFGLPLDQINWSKH